MAKTNTFILAAILILNAFYQSELGGPGTVFNSISFFLAVLFVLFNPRFDKFLALVFAFPLCFLWLSVFVNMGGLTVGGINSALATTIGYIFLMLNNPLIDAPLMKRLVVTYLIITLVLSVCNYVGKISTEDITMIANENFNINPNSAALCFFSCLLLSCVFLKGWKMWGLVLVFWVLTLTTGSRAGFISAALVIFAFITFNNVNVQPWHIKIFSKKTIKNYLFLAVFLIALYNFIPDTFSFLEKRMKSIGVGLSSSNVNAGSGRDEIWAEALKVSLKSFKNIMFGEGPASIIIGGMGSHSSYVEVIASNGWPFMVFTLIAVFYLLYHHVICKQNSFLIYGIAILIYGAVSTELFTGISSIWWIFIFLSIYYRSASIYKIGNYQRSK